MLLYLYILAVIAESEDGKGILSPILPVTDYLIFFDITFWNIASG